MMMQTKRVQVIVERSIMDKLAINVFLHEVPLLEVNHGEGSVTVLTELPIGSKLVDLRGVKKDAAGKAMFDRAGNPIPAAEIVELDANEEWARLEQRHGRHPEINMSIVEYKFRSVSGMVAEARELLAAAEPVKEGRPPEQEPGAVKAKPVQVQIKPKASDVEPDEDSEQPADVDGEYASDAELRAELKRLGIKSAKGDKTPDLTDKLRNGVLDKLDDLDAEYDPDASTKALVALADSLAEKAA